MSIPLYIGVQTPKDDPSGGCPAEANTGLFYDKFFDRWTAEEGRGSDLPRWGLEDKVKAQWVQTVTKKKVGDPNLIGAFTVRFESLVRSLGGEARYFKTDGRFVTGLGREHPVENGFAWHHTFGVPYLPGSSVKGVVRAWAGLWLKENSEEEIRHIFGEEDLQKPGLIGSVIFFDALPTTAVQLEPDVMTPHYLPYYIDGEAPGDWHSPNPIPFLTVADGQSFIFGLAPRTRENGGDVEKVWNWLEQALGLIGAGAKTAVGYGRFVPDREAQRAAELEQRRRAEAERKEREAAAQAARLAAASPLYQAMWREGYEDNPDRFMQNMGKWLAKLKDTDLAFEERCEIAQLLKEWYLKVKPDQWRKPNQKNQEKINVINGVLSNCPSTQ